MGAMVKMRPGTARNATAEHPIEAPAGRMIAVLIGAPDAEERIIDAAAAPRRPQGVPRRGHLAQRLLARLRPPLAARRGLATRDSPHPHSKALAARTAELAFAVPQVIAQRALQADPARSCSAWAPRNVSRSANPGMR